VDLFSSFEIKGRLFANRTVMAPMVMNCARKDGFVTSSVTDFYLARARAKVGLINLGVVYVHKDGQGFSRQLVIDELVKTDRRQHNYPSQVAFYRRQNGQIEGAEWYNNSGTLRDNCFGLGLF
jgi:hypothetical protein